MTKPSNNPAHRRPPLLRRLRYKIVSKLRLNDTRSATMPDETADTAPATLPLSELPPGEFKRIALGDTHVCVANVDGEVYAVHDTCTHAAIPLSDGCLEGRQIVCPWHGAMFDLKTGAATCGPAYDAVRTYPVTVEGDTISVSPPTD